MVIFATLISRHIITPRAYARGKVIGLVVVVVAVVDTKIAKSDGLGT